jgi:hypothetical protein
MGLLSSLGSIGGSLFGGPVGGAIGGLLGGALEGNSASDAANAATAATGAATDKATALQREQWLAQQEQQRPFREAGVTALNALTPLATNYQQFGMDQFKADPGYQFRLQEGLKQLGHAAGARGGLISGQTLKGLQDYAQNVASGEYTNAFNRYQTERAARLNPLQSLAGVGQTAVNQLGAAGQNYAGSVGNALINQGYAAGNAGLGAYQANQSMYGNLGKTIGGISGADWTNAGNKISNWWNTPSQNSGGYTNLEF